MFKPLHPSIPEARTIFTLFVVSPSEAVILPFLLKLICICFLLLATKEFRQTQNILIFCGKVVIHLKSPLLNFQPLSISFLYLLIPSTYFTHPPIPPVGQPPICSLYL